LIHKYSFFSIIGVRLIIEVLGLVIKSSYQSQAIKSRASILAIIKINDKTNEAGSQRDGASSDTIYNPVSGDFIISLSQ